MSHIWFFCLFWNPRHYYWYIWCVCIRELTALGNSTRIHLHTKQVGQRTAKKNEKERIFGRLQFLFFFRHKSTHKNSFKMCTQISKNSRSQNSFKYWHVDSTLKTDFLGFIFHNCWVCTFVLSRWWHNRHSFLCIWVFITFHPSSFVVALALANDPFLQNKLFVG